LQPLDRISGQLRAWDSQIRPQFTQQWNVFAEYLLGSRSSINVGYVGSNPTKVTNTIDANQPLPGTGDPRTWLPTQQRRPLYGFNPDITFLITTISRGFHSNYNALQTTFKQRTCQGLDFSANYTLSQAMSNARGSFGSAGVAAGPSTSPPVNSREPEANYRPAHFDPRHVAPLDRRGEPPFGRVRPLARGWDRR